jgi:hypothetical protein
MLRGAASKVMWVGRATVFLVGLAVILALLFGVASAALGANGNPFLLGRENAASQVSRLVKHGPGPALKLQVQDGQPPLAVNSDAPVANLNADKVDGEDSSAFLPVNGTAANATNATNAANADELDGQDSSAFLPVNGTAANADKVDGQDAEDLKPLLAVIEQDGDLSTNNRGVESAQWIDTGIYEVTFDRDVSSCPRVGSVAVPLTASFIPDPDIIPFESTPIDGHLTTFNSTNGDDKIGVLTRDSTGDLADRGFQLAVYC